MIFWCLFSLVFLQKAGVPYTDLQASVWSPCPAGGPEARAEPNESLSQAESGPGWDQKGKPKRKAQIDNYSPMLLCFRFLFRFWFSFFLLPIYSFFFFDIFGLPVSFDSQPPGKEAVLLGGFT